MDIRVSTRGWFIFALHIFFPTMLGAFIYTAWRSKTLLVFRLYKTLGLSPSIAAIRAHMFPWKKHLPPWLLFSLPDALWVYAFIAMLAIIWRDEDLSISKACWLLLPLALGVGGEIGQLAHLVPGTYDPGDVASYVIAGCAAFLFVVMPLERGGAI